VSDAKEKPTPASLPQPTKLTWEDHVWNGRATGATSLDGKRWSIGYWGGTREAPNFSLSVGDLLIIAVDIPTIEAAKELAQHLQNVLDGYVSARPAPAK
jgi:hypothetical protein